MLSSGLGFMKDDFLNSLRTEGKFDPYLKQINKLNMYLITLPS